MLEIRRDGRFTITYTAQGARGNGKSKRRAPRRVPEAPDPFLPQPNRNSRADLEIPTRPRMRRERAAHCAAQRGIPP
jgi:hypothetical protein